MYKPILPYVLGAILLLPAAGTATVWKVTTDSTETYIGGTIHVLRDSDYPLPPVFDKAYENANLVVFEIDPAKLAGPEVQQAILAKGMYPDSMGLDQVISEETYSKLKDFAGGTGIPVASLNRLKPALVMLTLLSFELQKLGVTQEGVDIHYANEARADEKPIEGLESVEYQIEMLTSMGDGYEDNFIMYMIEDMHEVQEKMPEMIAAWKTGDINKLSEQFISDLRQEFPDIYQAVIVDRNMNWLAPIENYVATPETEFILVGIAHLIGEDGVIHHLRENGYTVELLDMDEE